MLNAGKQGLQLPGGAVPATWRGAKVCGTRPSLPGQSTGVLLSPVSSLFPLCIPSLHMSLKKQDLEGPYAGAH